MSRYLAAASSAALLLASIVLANWLTSAYGPVPAGFGLMVTAGTYAAGLTLGLRDAVHDACSSVWPVLALIGAGAVVSALFGDGRIALASAVAFALAELVDMAVYARLRARRWTVAVAVSNAVGALADTLLFLTIAGFPLTAELVGGQLLVKAVWMTVVFLAVAEVVRRRRPQEVAA